MQKQVIVHAFKFKSALFNYPYGLSTSLKTDLHKFEFSSAQDCATLLSLHGWVS